jgi:predicted hydrocarbon binding protein
MPASENSPAAVGLDRLFDPRAFVADSTAGRVVDPIGTRIFYASHEFTRAIYHILLKEKPGAWREALTRTGRACGREIAVGLDQESARLALPALGALPLETCLVFLERTFVAHGWGVLKIDLADAADHGLVTAHLTHSYFAEVLSDVNDFVDPLPAGILQGFFEHISGEQLGCLEIACVRRGAPRCTFVITAGERLDSIAPLIGREKAEAIIARLKA